MASDNYDHTKSLNSVVIPIRSDPPTKKSKSARLKKETDPEKNPDFATIKLISQIVLFILKKCWIACSASIFIIFIINWYYSSLIAFLLLIFSLSGLLYQLSDWLLYQPDQPSTSRLFVPSPAIYGLPSENLYIVTKDSVKINVVFIKQSPELFSLVPTIIFFHGNAGNVGHRIANLQGLYHQCGVNILIVEYRGYGHSEGTPTEEGLYQDAQAALGYLLHHPQVNKSLIVVFGRSLGGSVAIELASHQPPILALVVENTFTTIPDIAQVLFNWRLLRWLPAWAYKNQFKSIEKVGKVKAPTLFISGQADTLIPPAMMKALYDKCGSVYKKLATFPGGTHNETWQCPGYYQTLSHFLKEVLGRHHGAPTKSSHPPEPHQPDM